MLAERAGREAIELHRALGLTTAARADNSGLVLFNYQIIPNGLGIALQHKTQAELGEMVGREDPLALPKHQDLTLLNVDPLEVTGAVQQQLNPNEILPVPVLEDDRNNVLTEEVLKYRRFKKESVQAAPAVESLKAEVNRARRIPWVQLVPSDIVKGLATGGLTIALLVQALPLFQTGREAQAADQTDKLSVGSMTPTPNSGLKIDVTPTPVPNNLLVPPSRLSSRNVEIQQLTQYSIDFLVGIKKYNWNFTNASYGIKPPNDYTIGTGTVRVNIDGVYYQSEDTQPLQVIYPTPVIILNMGGMAVNVPLDRYYFGTQTARPLSNIYDAFIEEGTGVTTPKNYTNRRQAAVNLIPEGINPGSAQYITLGSDSQGNWLRVMFDDTVNPARKGTYQTRLDQSGDFIDSTFVFLPNPTQTPTVNRLYLPLVVFNHN